MPASPVTLLDAVAAQNLTGDTFELEERLHNFYPVQETSADFDFGAGAALGWVLQVAEEAGGPWRNLFSTSVGRPPSDVIQWGPFTKVVGRFVRAKTDAAAVPDAGTFTVRLYFE